MADTPTLSAHEAALASERKDRAVSLLGLPELIAGVRVKALTPRILEWLRAVGNPFVCGGQITPEVLAQFLWHVSTHFAFEASQEKRDDLLAEILTKDGIREGIEAYLERAYLDAPDGTASLSYYSPAIGIYHAIKVAYPGDEWTLDRVLDTPFRVLFQLTKCADKYNGASVTNSRSSPIAAQFLTEVETVCAPDLDALAGIVDARKARGGKLYNMPSFNQRTGNYECAMTKEVSNG